jgi:hypothetical protein
MDAIIASIKLFIFHLHYALSNCNTVGVVNQKLSNKTVSSDKAFWLAGLPVATKELHLLAHSWVGKSGNSPPPFPIVGLHIILESTAKEIQGPWT